MLIESATVELLSPKKARVAWTGTAGLLAWAFVNGILRDGPVEFYFANRQLDLDVSDPFSVEIHECTDGETPEPIGYTLPQRPVLWWSPRADARKYLVYRKPNSGGSESVLGQVAHDDSNHYEFQGSQDLRQNGGIWNWFRIEALSARGAETVRAVWPHLIPGLPAKPTSCALAGVGGVFTVTLGV